MQTEDIILYQRCEWEVIEEVGEILPHIRVSILSQAFVVETIPVMQKNRQQDNSSAPKLHHRHRQGRAHPSAMQGSRDKTLLRLRSCGPRVGNSTSIDLPHRSVGRFQIRIGSSKSRAIVCAHVTIAWSRSPCLRHVHLRDLSAFVVSTKDGDPFWIPNLQSHQKTRGFHGMISAIHVVAHEQVIRVWCFASVPKQFHEVVKLPVDIPANRHRTLDRLHVGFFHQDFPRLVAQLFHFLLGERFALPKVLDLRVQVRVRIAGPCAGHPFRNLSLHLDLPA
mmetsp:Transcript_2873/g.17882  ORF Transcript_2873/g.17882 Transcript_2873/m.17882 type:complete len:279 (+) Transcript_2873:1407-2243(+)